MMFCVFFFFLMIRRPPRSTRVRSSAASDVYKRQVRTCGGRSLGREEDLLLAELGLDLVADEGARPGEQTTGRKQDDGQDESYAGEQGIECSASHCSLPPREPKPPLVRVLPSRGCCPVDIWQQSS